MAAPLVSLKAHYEGKLFMPSLHLWGASVKAEGWRMHRYHS
jgi:hypothetical protein